MSRSARLIRSCVPVFNRDLKEIFAQLAQTIVLVTHDIAEAAFLGDTLVLMNEGKIVQQGRLDDLRTVPHRPSSPNLSTLNAACPRYESGFAALLIFAAPSWRSSSAHGIAAEINIGSKRFTESYVLGEIATRVLRGEGLAAEHRQGMGGTIILWEALKGGAISAYPEYTGTITEEILHTQRAVNAGAHRERAGAIWRRDDRRTWVQ